VSGFATTTGAACPESAGPAGTTSVVVREVSQPAARPTARALAPPRTAAATETAATELERTEVNLAAWPALLIRALLVQEVSIQEVSIQEVSIQEVLI
jgi:hypothetical protein